MSKFGKILSLVLRSASDSNISFEDLRYLLNHLGFKERIRGSHHIFTKEGLEEILNLQPKGNKSKPYQVKQVRNIMLKYKLEEKQNEQV